LPNRRPDLVEEAGGGGFCSSEAVGAREERMEYVRCMFQAMHLSVSLTMFA
jgi:hypothetical protein